LIRGPTGTPKKIERRLVMSMDESRPTTASWDAGEMGCGGLILGLRRALDKLQANELLELVARSAGASVDVPAWCRITGHGLVLANHPRYIIRKKGDANV
jgi:tRNA 2-thiouridine synthesizing protein A